MKISKNYLATAMLLGFASPLCAQNIAPTQNPNSALQNLKKLDSTTTGPGLRVSKLIGMKIQNSRKENVGQIKDIVVDPASTRIQYVAVTYGGFLGLGDKLFAVPIRAIEVQQDPDSRDRVVLVLDVTKEQMNGAQGFDEANWPNFADKTFSTEIYRRYKLEDYWNHDVARNDGGLNVNVGKDGDKINVDGDKK